MKKRNDPRHVKRTRMVQQLFAWDFDHKQDSDQIDEIIKNLNEIDPLIQQAAPERPINEINKIDLAILRLSIFELIIVKDVPVKVIVDEAVELGKEFGSENSASFINGSLGNVITEQNLGQ